MKSKWSLELLWWVFTALIVLAVLFPIYNKIPDYPFWTSNVAFIVAFVTFTRYIFLLQYTFLAKRQVLKIVFVFLCIPAVFYLIQLLNGFQTFLDEEGIEAVTGNLPTSTQLSMVQYIRSEMLLFGVGSVISGVIFPFRLIASVWLYRNRGKI